MSEKPHIIDVEPSKPKQGRKGDGGTYLVVADDTEEFKIALAFACTWVKNHRARLGILHIIEDQDFQHWGAVEGRIKKEQREQGEKYLWTMAKMANDLGITPSLYVTDGEAGEALLKVIDADEKIVQLILGGGPDGHPGPLVSFCMGKGLSRLNVPVIVVPNHIKEFS